MLAKVRYLTVRKAAPGQLPRYFWQPSGQLRAEGWALRRVPFDWHRYLDPVALEGAAVADAMKLNAQLDEGRLATPPGLAPAAPRAAPTLSDLIVLYKLSPDWTGLAAKTQRGYLQCLGKIEAWGGDVPVRSITAQRFQRLLTTMSHTPSYRNAVARVVRLLLEFGRRRGFLDINPAIRPGLSSPAPSALIWPRDAVIAFVATADRLGRHSIGTAVLLNEWLGQREGDILRMPWHFMRNGTLWIRQSKTGAGVALPIGMVSHLVTRLEQERARQIVRAGTDKPLPLGIVVSEQTGLAYKEDHFRHAFADVRAALAKARPDGFQIDHLMPGRDVRDPGAFTLAADKLTFMNLRHTAVTRLAEAGCDAGQIATISGHSQATVQTIIERYMVRTATIARASFQRRIDAEAPAADTVRGTGS